MLLVTLANLGVAPDFLVCHRYPQGLGSESDAGLLQSGGSWAAHAATLPANFILQRSSGLTGGWTDLSTGAVEGTERASMTPWILERSSTVCKKP